MADHDDALICAWHLGERPRELAGWEAVNAWRPEDGPAWVHLDRKAPASHEWLREHSGLPPLVVEALLQEETRPRLAAVDNGLLVILRGVNLNPGADPLDMVSIRLWMDDTRVISLRGPKLMAVQDIRDALAAGAGPRRPGEWLATLAAQLTARLGPVLGDLDERLDTVEEALIDTHRREYRQHLIGIRREGITLRRYIAPQREVLARLAGERFPGIEDPDRSSLRETADRVTRHVEDLEALRDRAAVAQEELANRLADQMNRTMYALSLVATVFLPLGFVTGLLGVNVGGIPGGDDPAAFWILCGGLVAVVAGQIGLLWWRKWWF